MRRALLVGVIAIVACGNEPPDYPSPYLAGLGLHHAPLYLAVDLMPSRGEPLVLAHPRLGQPAIRRAGEPFDVGWIVPDHPAVEAQLLLDGTAPLSLDGVACDRYGICHGTAHAPSALGLHELCVVVAGVHRCSPGALAVVDAYHDPARVVQLSDAHVGDGDSAAGWHRVVDAVNALEPPADLAIFTGDGANDGLPAQRKTFLDELARLSVPVFAVTGNHDMDNFGLDGWLLEVGPELDYVAQYGALKLVGFSSGQDLDDGNHIGTLSESSGPDDTQQAWLGGALAGDAPTIVFFHHPLYNGLFGTVGPDTRAALLRLVTRDSVREVLVGHVHLTEVYDRDGESRDLSTSADTVPSWRWPLHYTCSRVTNYGGGFALHVVGSEEVGYRWLGL